MKDDKNSEHVFIFNALSESFLQTLFSDSELAKPIKTASVKFMLTKQDERDLLRLGYSQEFIEKVRPQEAMNIIQAAKVSVE